MLRPSYFLAVVGPTKSSVDGPGREHLAGHSRPSDTILPVAAGASRGHFLLSPSATVARTPGDRPTIAVLHGELYPDTSQNPAEYCLEAYVREGTRFVGGLHGSFVLAIVDQDRESIWFATDPVNSRTLFYGQHNGLAWFSTMHAFGWHPVTGKPDAAGIAHCLVNGVPMNGRTPFEGVRPLERASIHSVRGTDVSSTPYWRFEPMPRAGATTESLKGALRDALLGAVKRRVPSGGEVCLSLSGGYDSTAILGALGFLGVSDVSCISYKRPMEGDCSDADVARQMASIAGCPHTEIEAYGDDVGTVISENVRWGRGMTRLVVETDTWSTLRKLFPANRRSTFWVADECFGMNPPRDLQGDSDVLNSLAFSDWSAMGALGELFPPSVSADFADALREDLRSFIDRNRAIEDPYVLRDYLYFDQRLPRLLSWREAFAESCGQVRNPLIDREVLDLRQQFPQHLTLGKCLFKDTVTELFPDLFTMERAAVAGWYAGQWSRGQLRTRARELTRIVEDGPSSPLDSYLPPDAILRVIKEAGSASPWHRYARKLGRYRGRLAKRLRGIGSSTPRAPRPQQVPVDPAVFVLRAIILRELFRQRSTVAERSA